MTSFIDTLAGPEKDFAERLRKLILKRDKTVEEKPGAIMSAKDALCYLQEGVMKYGLARNKQGLTFHSMVMYANRDVAAFAKENLTGVRLQKGCVNIVSPDAFDMDRFDAFLRVSAEKDFSPVIAHYNKRMKGNAS